MWFQSTHVVLFASLDGLQGLFCLIIYDSTYELSFDSIDASVRASYQTPGYKRFHQRDGFKLNVSTRPPTEQYRCSLTALDNGISVIGEIFNRVSCLVHKHEGRVCCSVQMLQLGWNGDDNEKFLKGFTHERILRECHSKVALFKL